MTTIYEAIMAKPPAIRQAALDKFVHSFANEHPDQPFGVWLALCTTTLRRVSEAAAIEFACCTIESGARDNSHEDDIALANETLCRIRLKYGIPVTKGDN